MPWLVRPIEPGRSIYMEQGEIICFGPFRLDLQRRRLLRMDADVHLRRKVWDVLEYLARRPGVVVSNRDLIDALWPDVAVTPNALTRIVSELRQALGGKDASDEYLRTVPKRGFLFTANGTAGVGSQPATATDSAAREAPWLIGRDAEVAQLMQAWRRAAAGQRQVAFVTGVPGVGKSTLVEAVVEQIRDLPGAAPLIAKGQCLRLQGESEPFLPVLEMLEQVLEQLGEGVFVDQARRYAPTWLVQMPWLLPADDLAAQRRSLAASGMQRVLRDGVRLLERLAEHTPVLLVFEDMQWADASTLDLLVAIAERSTTGRLMLMATYRAIEASLTGHPIGAAARALSARSKALFLEIDAWPLCDVAAYLDRRFGSVAIKQAFAARIESRTHGNPLFVQETVDHLVRSGHVHEVHGEWISNVEGEPENLSLPPSLRDLVEDWLAQQPATTIDTLEAASLIEGGFTVQEVAAAVGREECEVDDSLCEIERRSRLVERVGVGRWPDSTTTLTYKFSHALYQRALGERVAPLRRSRLHLAIARRLEAGFRGELGKVAARLAAHFEAGGDDEKCVAYLEMAAATAFGRYAYADAAADLRRAIECLQRQAPSPERLKRQAERWLDHANLLIIGTGMGNLPSRRACESALRIADEIGDGRLSFRAQLGLSYSLGFGGDLERAMEINLRLIDTAEATNRRLLPVAHLYLGMSETALGQFQSAFDRSVAALSMEAEPGIPLGTNLKLGLQAQLVVCQALLVGSTGLDAQIDRLFQYARQSAVPLDRLAASTYAAAALAWNRRWDEGLELASEALALADELDRPSYQTLVRILLARCRVREDPSRLIEEIELQLRVRAGLGEHWWNSCFFGWLAESYQRVGDLDLALVKTDAALALQEQSFRSEAWRIRGAILDAQGRIDEAEVCLREGLNLAQVQGARVFAVRAAVALSRLLKRQSRCVEARNLLEGAYGESTRACDSPDFAEARAELGALAERREVDSPR